MITTLCIDQINQKSQLAIAAYEADQSAQAIALCAEILKAMPAHPYALNLLGVLTLEAGQLQAAITTYRDAQAHNCMNDMLYSNLGAHLQTVGDWGEAETAYRAALALNPHYTGALYNLGHLISLQHRHQEAETLLRRALAHYWRRLDACKKRWLAFKRPSASCQQARCQKRACCLQRRLQRPSCRLFRRKLAKARQPRAV
jgi:tetratricopeptide (TPR) repeat protein